MQVRTKVNCKSFLVLFHATSFTHVELICTGIPYLGGYTMCMMLKEKQMHLEHHQDIIITSISVCTHGVNGIEGEMWP